MSDATASSASAAAPVVATPDTTTTTTYKPVCLEMSNANLLKLDTHDTYNTANALKKIIAQACPPPLTGDISKGELLFPGLIRMSKNPKIGNLYCCFETPEQREHAKTVLTTHMKHRKQQLWVEVPVTEKDLQLTHRGAGQAEGSNNTTNENSSSLSNKAAKRQVREGDERTSNTAQWASFPYFVQIQKKTSHCRSIIRQIASGRLQRHLSTYNCQQLVDNLDIIQSPNLSGYRNHVNFTCGYDAQHRPVIGMVAGSVLDGLVAIEDVTGRHATAPTADETSTIGAALIPLTTNMLSVAYAKAVMEVVIMFEAYKNTSGDGKTYKLGMLDKGAQMSEHKKQQQPCGAVAEGEETSPSGEPDAKRGARAEVVSSSATDVVSHPFWRRVQIRHSTVGKVMIDLEVDPSVLPADVIAAIKAALIEKLQAVEKTFDGEAAEIAENANAERILKARLLAKKQQQEMDGVVATTDASAEAADEDANKPDEHRVVSRLPRPQPLVIPTSKLVSLQWHFHSGTTMCPHEAPRETLFGTSTLVENLCGMKFLLSPPSFFQVNTPTTEKMLERVAEVAQLRPTTTLLDLCCGTGIIGICLSKYVKKIVGIEMVVSAVENAKVNAANNNVTEKTTYYAAKVEDALNQAMATMTAAEKEDIVAIFDPPRAGMHPSVLSAVRNFPQIRRIVYISCDQQALVRDCPSLMKEPTKKFRGTPYVIDGSFGIDLFPQTPHVEQVVVMSKVSSEAMDKYYDVQSKYGVKGGAAAEEEKPAAEDEETAASPAENAPTAEASA